MAVQFKHGVVIGADSRTTTGSYIVSINNRSSLKTSPTMLCTGQQGNRQADPHPRPHILLSLRLSRRHPSDRGHRALLHAAVLVSTSAPYNSALHSSLRRQTSGERPSVHTAAAIFQ